MGLWLLWVQSQLLLAFVGNAVSMGQTAFKAPSIDADDDEQHSEAEPQEEETRTATETAPCSLQHDTLAGSGAEAEEDVGQQAGERWEEQEPTELPQTERAISAAGSEQQTSSLQRRLCARSDSDTSETAAAPD